MEVLTDEGLIGLGSVMTSKRLVATEKPCQRTFWQGYGGASDVLLKAALEIP